MAEPKVPSLGARLALNFQPVKKKKAPAKIFNRQTTVNLSYELEEFLLKEANLADISMRVHMRNILLDYMARKSDNSETQEQVAVLPQSE